MDEDGERRLGEEDVSGEDWSFLNELLEKLMALDPCDRPVVAMNATRQRPHLKDWIDKIVASIPQAERFLEEPVWNPSEEDLHKLDSQICTDLESVGRFEIVKPLGVGGMGRVYLARQKTPFNRDVAIKAIIPPYGKTDTFRDAFFLECQALAKMDHVHVAKIFEADITKGGIPYLTMDYCDGITIAEYVGNSDLPIVSILKLFLQVCSGVHHAHQKRILHRDLKPSNILVVEKAEGAKVKIIDFGIAQSLDPLDAAENKQASIVAGTLFYMSSEQLLGQDLDCRADVYSLGVILHELLVGFPPFETATFKGTDLSDGRDRILAAQPSLASHSLLQQIEEGQRDNSAMKRVNRLKGDLDYIIQKAIAKDRENRYDDVNALAADIRAHLSMLPLTDLAGDNPYVLKKFIRRHGALVKFVAGAFLMMLLLIVTLSISLKKVALAKEQARQAREEVEVQADYLRDTVRFLQDILASPRLERHAMDTKLSETLEVATTYLEANPQPPQVSSEIYQTLGRSHLSIGNCLEARDCFEKALALRKSLYGADHEKTLRAKERLATSYTYLNQWDEAECLYREVLLVQDEPNMAQLACRGLADMLRQRGDFRAALIYYYQVLPWSKTRGLDQYYVTLKGLGIVYQRLDQPQMAEPLFREALEHFSLKHGPEHPYTLAALNNWADALLDLGQQTYATQLFADAYRIRQRILVQEHPATLDSLHNYARSLYFGKQYSLALDLAQVLTDLRKKALGREHMDTINAMDLLGRCHNRLGNRAKAIEILSEAREMGRASLDPGHPFIINVGNNLADLLIQDSRPGEAVDLLTEIVPLADQTHGPWSKDTLLVKITLGEALIGANRLVEAQAHFSILTDESPHKLKNDHDLQGLFGCYLAWVHAKLGDQQEAASLFKNHVAKLRLNQSRYLNIGESILNRLDPP